MVSNVWIFLAISGWSIVIGAIILYFINKDKYGVYKE
jgi:hypothetical protein